MKQDFEFIKIPNLYKKIVGIPDPGTRMFRAYGDEDAFDIWWDAILRMCKPFGAVSPGGVSMFTRVSRAGVHQRMKNGGLTAFLFHLTKPIKLLLGRETVNRDTPYILIPIKECKAWADYLKNLASEEEQDKEAVGEGDYHGMMLYKIPRDWRRARIRRRKKRKQSNGEK